MGLFRKEEKIHFERDPETGEVIRMTKNGQPYQPEPMMKTSKQLEQEYYEKHPGEKHPGLQKLGHGLKRLDTAIVNYNRRQPVRPFTPRKGTPTHQNYNPIGSIFDTGMKPMKKPKKKGKTKYTVISGKAYPIAGTGKKKKDKKKGKRKSVGFGDMDMFDSQGFFK